MNKIVLLSLFLAIGLTACKNSSKAIDKLEIAKEYYNILDNSDYSKIGDLLRDSLLQEKPNTIMSKLFR